MEKAPEYQEDQIRWLISDVARLMNADDAPKGIDFLQKLPKTHREKLVFGDPDEADDMEKLSTNTTGVCLCAVMSQQNVKRDQTTQDLDAKIIETLDAYLQKPTNFERAKSTILGDCNPLSYATFVLRHCDLLKGCYGDTADERVIDVWMQLAKPVAEWLQTACLDHMKSNAEWNLPIPKPHNINDVRLANEEKKSRIYEEFHKYDFDSDQKFQAGLGSIMSATHGGLSILQAKLFYFSKFYHEVSHSEYEKWLHQLPRDRQKNVGAGKTDTEGSIYSNKPDDVASGVSDPSEDNDSRPHYPSSFFDLLQKIEKGEPLPGVEELNIQPTNTSPMQSTMDKKPKPWQKE